MAAKKKAAKKSKVAPKINLTPGGIAPCKPRRKQGTAVTWHNSTSITRNVVFTAGYWPFTGVQAPIAVLSKGNASRTLRTNLTKDDTYDYSVAGLKCKAHKKAGPPDGPAVVIDD